MTEPTQPGSMRPPVSVPRYEDGSLADVVPSLLSAMGVPGFHGRLNVDPIAGAGVLLVDGLGWELLRAHPAEAPFLWRATERGRAITSGFPATTTSSLGSLGTGLPPGEHGLVGYAVAVPGHDRAMNLLHWELYGSGPQVDLRQEIPPERFQPAPTALQRASASGVEVSLVGPPHLARSPLERAVLRGGKYQGAHSLGDLVTATVGRLGPEAGPADPQRRFVYAYHPGLDQTGHVRGCGSEAWALELANVDRLVAAIVERLPPGVALAVTGDHGMVDLPPEDRLELADHRDLSAGVRLLAGEARARHVHTVPGAEEDVLAAWRAILGDRMWVVSGAEAMASGWFGPRVAPHVRERVGDVVAAAHGRVGVFQKAVDARQAKLVGHHGSMTPAEQLVPFLLFRR